MQIRILPPGGYELKLTRLRASSISIEGENAVPEASLVTFVDDLLIPAQWQTVRNTTLFTGHLQRLTYLFLSQRFVLRHSVI
jgi:hypothetical protein